MYPKMLSNAKHKIILNRQKFTPEKRYGTFTKIEIYTKFRKTKIPQHPRKDQSTVEGKHQLRHTWLSISLPTPFVPTLLPFICAYFQSLFPFTCIFEIPMRINQHPHINSIRYKYTMMTSDANTATPMWVWDPCALVPHASRPALGERAHLERWNPSRHRGCSGRVQTKIRQSLRRRVETS